MPIEVFYSFILLLQIPLGPIYVMSMSPDGQFVVSGSQERTIKIFDLQKKQLVHLFKFAHEDAITSITVSPNGRFIVSGSQDRSIKIFDVENKEEVYNFKEAHEGFY